ncbi:hypothetical protein CEXT_614001 [Caerostris extrusa]|uniref:Uncharacterized protein n=1 Tax=Caerostris extrusa TaxID=172846 RepID=A0AAV4QV33_CAEEX|nr:hypothetical protein CEXT_614001 [Caerostris extrusa]
MKKAGVLITSELKSSFRKIIELLFLGLLLLLQHRRVWKSSTGYLTLEKCGLWFTLARLNARPGVDEAPEPHSLFPPALPLTCCPSLHVRQMVKISLFLRCVAPSMIESLSYTK